MVQPAHLAEGEDTGEAARSDGTPRWAWGLAAVVAAVPILRMLVYVLRSTFLQHNDYWPMLDSMLTADGGFHLSGVFELRNEHPVVTAKLLYWADLKLFGGSNIALGLVVLAVAVGQVAVIAVLARDLGRRWSLAPPIVVAASSVLLFSQVGAWHFMKSMSGAAWLTTNLYVLLAIWAQHRDRRYLAIGFAWLATISYGTGLVTWPALVVVSLLSGQRVRRLAPTVVAGVAAVVWVQWKLSSLPHGVSARPRLAVWGYHSAEVVGAYLFPHHRVTSIRVGETIMVAAGLMAMWATIRIARRWSPDAQLAAPWVGVALFGAGMAFLVAGGRNTILWSGTAGRYAAIGALLLVGLIGLVAAVVPLRPPPHPERRALFAGAVLVLCGFVFQSGDAEVQALDAANARQDLMAVALHTHLVSGSTLWLGGLEYMSEGIEDRLAAAGQDFGLRHSIDCGRLGDTLTTEERSGALPAGVSGEVVRLAPSGVKVPRAMEFDGWVDGADLECVVLVDLEGKVVGAGGHGKVSHGYGGTGAFDQPGRTWFSGMAPQTDGTTVYVALTGRDGFFPVPYAG